MMSVLGVSMLVNEWVVSFVVPSAAIRWNGPTELAAKRPLPIVTDPRMNFEFSVYVLAANADVAATKNIIAVKIISFFMVLPPLFRRLIFFVSLHFLDRGRGATPNPLHLGSA